MNITSVLRIESRTSPKNFEARSASFYVDVETLAFLMGHKEVLLAHVNNQTEEVRLTVVRGYDIYNQAEIRKIKGGKHYCIFRY